MAIRKSGPVDRSLTGSVEVRGEDPVQMVRPSGVRGGLRKTRVTALRPVRRGAVR